MKSNNDVLLDIINLKKKTLKFYIEELESSIVDLSDSNDMVRKYYAKMKYEELGFFNEIYAGVKDSDNGVKYLKIRLKSEKIYENFNDIDILRVSKYSLLNELLNEYKCQCKEVYRNNKYLSTKGIFDNDLFCNLIKEKIKKYTECNSVTKKKYSHMAAFLNEFLQEMLVSENPLKTLKQKIKMYEKYKNTEYVEIRYNKKSKVEILKEIIYEYNKVKSKLR